MRIQHALRWILGISAGLSLVWNKAGIYVVLMRTGYLLASSTTASVSSTCISNSGILPNNTLKKPVKSSKCCDGSGRREKTITFLCRRRFLEYTGENASLTTKLQDLDNFGTLGGSDSISITGTDHNGMAISSSFNVTQYTTVEDLIGEINEAFDGTATASFSKGRIVITDNAYGTSSMTLDLEYNGTSTRG